jgi:hypothetical protein
MTAALPLCSSLIGRSQIRGGARTDVEAAMSAERLTNPTNRGIAAEGTTCAIANLGAV